MKDINTLILFCCTIFLLMYFKFINLQFNLSKDLIQLFVNPFFRLFSLLIIILITHDINFILGIIISVIYIIIIEQSIKANTIYS